MYHNFSPPAAQRGPKGGPTGAQQGLNGGPTVTQRGPNGGQTGTQRGPTGAQREPNRGPRGLPSGAPCGELERLRRTTRAADRRVGMRATDAGPLITALLYARLRVK